MIFINYRREDSRGVTGRIDDHLRAAFGRDQVFRDIDNIPLGVDFVEHIGLAVGRASVALVVIGTDWHSERLADANDFVRLEIEAALTRKIPVIPVLVDGGAVPTASSLPETLRSLVRRNAISIDSGADFDTHIARLIQGIRAILTPGVSGAGVDRPTATSLTGIGRSLPGERVTRLRPVHVALVAVGLALVASLFFVVRRFTDDGTTASPSLSVAVLPPAPTNVANAGVAAPSRSSDTTSGPHAIADVSAMPSPETPAKPGGSQPQTSPTATLTATLKVTPAVAEKLRENQGAISKNVAKPVAANVRITEIIFFNGGSSKISSSTLPLIDQVARTILANPDTTVFVQGHTSVEEATTLAQQRANSVYQSLVSRGVPREQLMITSLGNTQPIADNATENGREKNRRVSFVVTK